MGDYGKPVRILEEQERSLDTIAASLTAVRDSFYRERGQKPPGRPISRREGLGEAIALAEAVSTGKMMAVTVEDIQNGEVLKGDNPLTVLFRHLSVLSALGLARHLGHTIRWETDAAGFVTDIEIDDEPLGRDVIDREANKVLHELAPKAH